MLFAALLLACFKGSAECTAALLAHGESVSLSHAVSHCLTQLTQSFAVIRCDTLLLNELFPLMPACYLSLSPASVAPALGASVHAHSSQRGTPFQTSVELGHLEVMKLLLEHASGQLELEAMDRSTYQLLTAACTNSLVFLFLKAA